MEEYIYVDNYIEFPVMWINEFLQELGIEKKVTKKDIVEAKTVYRVSSDIEFITLGGEKLVYQKYIGAKVGRKYIHLYYRTPHMYDASRGKVYFYYFKIRR